MAHIKRFNRYELKYVIHASKQRAIAADLLHFMSPDENGDKDGYYRVTSLYYDSPDLSFYRSKIEGIKYRRKLRVRVYPGDDPRTIVTAFAEIKQRMNRTVQKRRIVLPLDDALALCGGDYDPERLQGQDAETASEILYMQRVMRLTPKCIVNYRRRAFMGSRYEQGMRVTFDMLLQGRTSALVLNELAKDYYFMPPDWFVMEVKVNERIPTWMISLLAKHECSLQRVSKYCSVVSNGMKRFRIAYANKEPLHG
jgi:VTC domain